MEEIRFKERSGGENKEDDDEELYKVIDVKTCLARKLKKIVEDEPLHVQVCLGLALLTHIVGIIFNSSDIYKTTIFYIITGVACSYCDW